jgi:serine/threonine-protein kinase
VIGRTVGNYVVKDKIGAGGMGVVYLAEHPRIHRKVAIKVLLPELSRNSNVVARLARFRNTRETDSIYIGSRWLNPT